MRTMTDDKETRLLWKIIIVDTVATFTLWIAFIMHIIQQIGR